MGISRIYEKASNFKEVTKPGILILYNFEAFQF